METNDQKISTVTPSVPKLIVSRQSSIKSDSSLSPSEFDRIINTNFPQILAGADDIGFESMRSDATNITSAGLSTLYYQAKSSSTPSLLAELSLSESTKKAINNLERCLQDIGPESGIGISPADFGDYGSSSNNLQTSNNLLVLPNSNELNENKWSLNSSLEIGEDSIGGAEECQLSLYTTPDNRVERQLYSLDGIRRSSFESVYSPPVVSEQVVNEVIHVSPQKATIFIQDDRPSIRPVKELTPPSRVHPIMEAPAPSSTSVTTSISEIISTPPTETSPSIPEKDNKVKDASSVRSAATLGKAESVPEARNQSERSSLRNECRELITTVVTAPVAGRIQSNSVEPVKITPKPRIHTVSQVPQKMGSSDDDNEWAKKIQEIAQWQADVNLAMQSGVPNGTFINSPGEEIGEEFTISEAQRPKPLKRRNGHAADQHKSTMQYLLTDASRTFECNAKPINGNKLENMQWLLQHSGHWDDKRSGINRNDMFSRRFGVPPNQQYDQHSRFPKPQNIFPVTSQKGPAYSKSTISNLSSEEPVYHVIDLSKQNGQNTYSQRKFQPKASVLIPCSRSVEVRPTYLCKDLHPPFSRNFFSGYAEALSLATAANDAVSEAFSRRGCYDAKQIFKHPASLPINDAFGYKSAGYQSDFQGNRLNSELMRTTQHISAITRTYLNGQNIQPIKRTSVTSFNGTGRIIIPARPLQPIIMTPTALSIRNPNVESSKPSNPLRNHLAEVPTTLTDLYNRRSPHSTTPTGQRNPHFSTMTRSQSVGPTIIPPPADASAYPLVTDLSRGLKYVVTSDNSKIAPKVQVLPPKKFILGRVASNEDICIETETPFSFNIAAKGKQICIAKVASADDLRRPLVANAFSADLEDNEEMERGIPVSLRLTFGSTPCVSSVGSKSAVRESALNKTFRSVLHINMSGSENSAGKLFGGPKLRPSRTLMNEMPFRGSLPSLPKPPIRSPSSMQGANLTFFEQDI